MKNKFSGKFEDFGEEEQFLSHKAAKYQRYQCNLFLLLHPYHGISLEDWQN